MLMLNRCLPNLGNIWQTVPMSSPTSDVASARVEVCVFFLIIKWYQKTNTKAVNSTFQERNGVRVHPTATFFFFFFPFQTQIFCSLRCDSGWNHKCASGIMKQLPHCDLINQKVLISSLIGCNILFLKKADPGCCTPALRLRFRLPVPSAAPNR